MGWAAVISMILEIFGPLLMEWLKKWLEGRLARSAQRLGDIVPSNKTAAVGELLDAAIADTRRGPKRALLRFIKRKGLTAKFGDDEMDEFRDLVSEAEGD